MVLRLGINGFGRIGRSIFRIAHKNPEVEVVAINDLLAPDKMAYFTQYDSVHGRFSDKISYENDCLMVGSQKIRLFSENNPKDIRWGDAGVDYVIESSGLFTNLEAASGHLKSGAKKVIISAPPKGDIPVIVLGVNENSYDSKNHHVISNASCTTNCLAPITKVLLDNFGIEEGLMTTVHATTASQPTVDGGRSKSLRDGRAAGVNIIPASTGAAKAVGLCIPEVKGKLTGMAFRVPVADVSVVDLTVKLTKSTDYDTICEAMKNAAESSMKGILEYTEDHVVSSDFIGSSYSSIFDKGAGIALSDTFFKIISWYDNEIGYSHRVVDLAIFMSKKN